MCARTHKVLFGFVELRIDAGLLNKYLFGHISKLLLHFSKEEICSKCLILGKLRIPYMKILVFYFLPVQVLQWPMLRVHAVFSERPAKARRPGCHPSLLQLFEGDWGRGEPGQMLSSFGLATAYCSVIGGNKAIFTSGAKNTHLPTSGNSILRVSVTSGLAQLVLPSWHPRTPAGGALAHIMLLVSQTIVSTCA